MFPHLHKEISILTLKNTQDIFDYDSCPNLFPFTKQQWNAKYQESVRREYIQNGVLPQLSRLTGKKELSLQDAKNIWDSLTCRMYFGKSIGEYEPLYSNLSQLALTLANDPLTFNQTILATWGAPQILFTVKQIDQLIQSKMDETSYLKVSLLGYHQMTIMPSLALFGYKLKKFPEFTAMLLFEVWQEEGIDFSDCEILEDCFKHFYVRFQYNDEALLVPGDCKRKKEGGCRVDEWRAFVLAQIAQRDESLCQVKLNS